ncbi:uncharacterized protein [Musca autumnalis]|uniref:uncharacterized protein n=1 Tax=Musca autumnalis TaxID=221902 RepID=UPI003CF832AF
MGIAMQRSYNLEEDMEHDPKQINLKKDNNPFMSHRNELISDCCQIDKVTRKILRSIAHCPRENLFENINQCIRRQSKLLLKCCNEATECQYGIMDLVTERLNGCARKDNMPDYHVPNSNYEDVNIYISSNDSNSSNETIRQYHQKDGQHSKAENFEVNDDVHIGVDFM